jgi:NADPH oxidase
LNVRGIELIAPFTANFLRINVYLTQKIGEDMLWNIAVNDAGAEYDPLTLLRSRTMFGRPDWMTIYGQMRQAIETGQYIPGSKSQLKTKVGVSVHFLFNTTPV